MKTSETLGRMSDAELRYEISTNPQCLKRIPVSRLTKDTVKYLYYNLHGVSLSIFVSYVAATKGIETPDEDVLLGCLNDISMFCRLGMRREWWTTKLAYLYFFPDGDFCNSGDVHYVPDELITEDFLKLCVVGRPRFVYEMPQHRVTDELRELAFGRATKLADKIAVLATAKQISDSIADSLVDSAFNVDGADPITSRFDRKELATFLRVLKGLRQTDLTKEGELFIDTCDIPRPYLSDC